MRKTFVVFFHLLTTLAPSGASLAQPSAGQDLSEGCSHVCLPRVSERRLPCHPPTVAVEVFEKVWSLCEALSFAELKIFCSCLTVSFDFSPYNL